MFTVYSQYTYTVYENIAQKSCHLSPSTSRETVPLSLRATKEHIGALTMSEKNPQNRLVRRSLAALPSKLSNEIITKAC